MRLKALESIYQEMQTKKAEIFFRYFLNQHWAKPYSIVIFLKKKKVFRVKRLEYLE